MSDNYEYKTVDGKKVLEHVSVMEALLGRKLEPNEVVHHINGNKKDNRPENLQVMDRGEHARLHSLGAHPSPETISKISEGHLGKANPNRKLSENDVIEILKLFYSGKSKNSIAKKFKISNDTVTKILEGKNYRDITSKLGPELFPLKDNSTNKSYPNYDKRRFSVEEVSKIRIMLECGYSANSIAKMFGVRISSIQKIRDGLTYKDIPKPKLIEQYIEINNLHNLADIMLLKPVPSGTDPVETLKNEYKLLPSRNAVIMFSMLQKALNGDAEVAAMLFALSSFDYMIDDILKDNSSFLNM